MKLLQKLRSRVAYNCISQDDSISTLEYWSDIIFAKTVFYLAPLGLIAIIPAVIIALDTESYLILNFNIFCFVVLVGVGYIPDISVKIRKKSLVLLLFMTAFVLLLEVGNFGPGLVYLLASTVFILLLFPGKRSIVPFILLLTFCVLYGFVIYFNLYKTFPEQNINLLEWIAASTSVLFVSAILMLMIPFFLSKLESTVKEKQIILESLEKTNSELSIALDEVNSKNEELEQFAYIASHDLQEPLRMVTSFVEKLKQKYSSQIDEKGLQYIHFATDGANRMKQIILDLLEYSRAGKSTVTKEEVDVNQLLSDWKVLRRKLITEKSAEIKFDQLPIITTYKAPLVQVLHCLLDNAIKYSDVEQKPQVSVDIKYVSDLWEVTVKDNGIGIAPEFHEKVFVIFQRLHNKNEFAGSGIGLAIVKKQVESWGGEIGLNSEVGKGSTFYFTVPK